MKTYPYHGSQNNLLYGQKVSARARIDLWPLVPVAAALVLWAVIWFGFASSRSF